ncbi:MAG: site-2 protease family protein [Bacteroidota bacterium]
MNQRKQRLIQLGLFILTLILTTISGAEWMYARSLIYSFEPLTFSEVLSGLEYSIPFLLILTVHEFGHYFMAQYHKVKVTLPFYIPLWLGFIGAPSIGTMGAFIAIQQKRMTKKQYFDIGVAGPLAGFVVALAVIFYGFSNLPEPEHIFEIHPEYEFFGKDYEQYVYDADTFFTKTQYEQKLGKPAKDYWLDTVRVGNVEGGLSLGNNLIYMWFTENVAEQPQLVPNPFELFHYPWLFAGYLALFFTALNLLPIGQLDGGHVVFGLFGYKRHKIISLSLFSLFVFYAGLGLINPYMPFDDLIWYIPMYVLGLLFVFQSASKNLLTKLTFAISIFSGQFIIAYFNPTIEGYSGWLFFAFILGRFLGLKHPPAVDNEPLDNKRKIIGWLALLVFVLSFSPSPFSA